MVFSSTTFLFFFLPLFFATYFLVSGRFKNGVALFFSLLFYSWGGPLFVFILVASALLDFILSHQMSGSVTNKKRWLALGVLINVLTLMYFKYANFFIQTVHDVSGIENTVSTIALPIGISFFTFQKISYLIDIYRGQGERVRRFGDYLLFVTLFPQLIAGPIVRYKDISDRLIDRREYETIDRVFSGFVDFVLGLSKKVLLANVLGAEVEKIFGGGGLELNSGLVWLGMLGYTFQIYFDFSGYSQMAIGIGRMLGFDFPQNFNFPYVSRSITEFWQRWHMTLGSWMKDYLYIPLGGNRLSVNRTYLNLSIVFVLSGFWHGASWNFILWGFFHGVLLVVERKFPRFWKKIGGFGTVITFLLVLVGWVFFRFETIEEAKHICYKLFEFDSFFVPDGYVSDRFFRVLLTAAVLSFFPLIQPFRRFQKLPSFSSMKEVMIVSFILLFLLIWCTGELASVGYNPFIYFKF